MVRGRWFTDGEAAAVLNESLARREMGGRDPIGRRIRTSDDGPLLTVVGVARDVKFSQLDAPAEPEVYCLPVPCLRSKPPPSIPPSPCATSNGVTRLPANVSFNREVMVRPTRSATAW